MVLERPDLARLHLPRAEVVEDRRLHLLVDHPVVARGLGDAHLAAVERRDRLLGGHSTSSRICGGPLAFVLRRHERHPHITLAGRAEERARRDEDPVRRAGAARRPPTGRRPRARGRTSRRRRPSRSPLRLEDRQERLPLAPVHLADRLDVLLVGPRGDRRPAARTPAAPCPTDGRNARSASATSRGAQTKPAAVARSSTSASRAC